MPSDPANHRQLERFRSWLDRLPFLIEALLVGLYFGCSTWLLLAWWGTIDRGFGSAMTWIVRMTLLSGPLLTWLNRRARAR